MRRPLLHWFNFPLCISRQKTLPSCHVTRMIALYLCSSSRYWLSFREASFLSTIFAVLSAGQQHQIVTGYGRIFRNVFQAINDSIQYHEYSRLQSWVPYLTWRDGAWRSDPFRPPTAHGDHAAQPWSSVSTLAWLISLAGNTASTQYTLHSLQVYSWNDKAHVDLMIR